MNDAGGFVKKPPALFFEGLFFDFKIKVRWGHE